MTRTLTITAAEWASVHDGTLILVREGGDVLLAGEYHPIPPVEFVQACAPCECGGADALGVNGPIPTCDCRIELVGLCLVCVQAGDCGHQGCPISDDCYRVGPLGHAHAVGQPEQRPDGKWALRLAVQP